jgi:hypothetical protein
MLLTEAAEVHRSFKKNSTTARVKLSHHCARFATVVFTVVIPQCRRHNLSVLCAFAFNKIHCVPLRPCPLALNSHAEGIHRCALNASIVPTVVIPYLNSSKIKKHPYFRLIKVQHFNCHEKTICNIILYAFYHHQLF